MTLMVERIGDTVHPGFAPKPGLWNVFPSSTGKYWIARPDPSITEVNPDKRRYVYWLHSWTQYRSESEARSLCVAAAWATPPPAWYGGVISDRGLRSP
jgi:hypothetical protein